MNNCAAATQGYVSHRNSLFPDPTHLPDRGAIRSDMESSFAKRCWTTDSTPALYPLCCLESGGSGMQLKTECIAM